MREVKSQGYQDVFVHNKYGGCGDLSVGDKVSFQCYLSLKKQPQAKNVIIIESTKPKPLCVARPLAPEDQAIAESLKPSAMAMEKGDSDKGKGKGRKARRIKTKAPPSSLQIFLWAWRS